MGRIFRREKTEFRIQKTEFRRQESGGRSQEAVFIATPLQGSL
jgi:hypothetical protein